MQFGNLFMWKRKVLPTKFTKNLALFCFKKIKNNLNWKVKVLKQADYNGYVMAEQSKYVKISMYTFPNSFFREIRKA